MQSRNTKQGNPLSTGEVFDEPRISDKDTITADIARYTDQSGYTALITDADINAAGMSGLSEAWEGSFTTPNGLSIAAEILNVEQTATYLDVSINTLAKWRVNGSGPPFARFGRRIGYPTSLLREYVADNIHRSTSDTDDRHE